MKVDFVCHTDGSGHWSDKTAAVPIRKIYLNYFDPDLDGGWPHGELHAVFDRRVWNVMRDGLIYTDPTWEQCLRNELKKLGLSLAAVNSVSYSEQGMQGEDYVSLDVGREFFSRGKLAGRLLDEYLAGHPVPMQGIV